MAVSFLGDLELITVSAGKPENQQSSHVRGLLGPVGVQRSFKCLDKRPRNDLMLDARVLKQSRSWECW